MRSKIPYLVLLLAASCCAWAEDDNVKQQAHTTAMVKANHAYDYLLRNKDKVAKPEQDNSILCINKLDESLQMLVEAQDFNAAIKAQEGCASAITSTSGVMSDVKAKVEEAIKAGKAVTDPSAAPSEEANSGAKAQNNAVVKAAQAYLWLAELKDNVVESERGLADKCAESIAASIDDINKEDYKSAVSSLSACADSLQGDRLPELKQKTTAAIDACKATEGSASAPSQQQSTGGTNVQKDPEMVANEAYIWLQNSDNTEKLGKPEKEAVEKCTTHIASSIHEIHTKDYKKAIDSLLNCANSTMKGQLLPEVYKKSMEASNLCQTLKKTNKPVAAPSGDNAAAPAPSEGVTSATSFFKKITGQSNKAAAAPSTDTAAAPAPSSEGLASATNFFRKITGISSKPAAMPSSDSAAVPAPSSEGADSAAPTPSYEGADSAAPTPSSGGSDSDAPSPSSDESDSAAPAPSSDGGSDSAAPAPSSDGLDSATPTPSSDGSDSAAPEPSSDGADSAAPAPSSDGADSDAPAPSSDGVANAAPTPSSDGLGSAAPAPLSDIFDSAAPEPSSDGLASAAKKATQEADDAYLLINDNRSELDKLDPNGTDVCFKMLSSAMSDIAREVQHKAQLELQDCVNALASPKGKLVDVKAKTEKAIEYLKAQ